MTDKKETVANRRRFLKLGAALGGTSMFAASATVGSDKKQKTPQRIPLGIDLEKWNRIKGEPYAEGKFGKMPGVCQLPGPLKKRNWPDRNKYKGVKKVHGMCQLCSTVCGITGYVKDDRLIKI